MLKDKYDITFFFPAIRTNLWLGVYESLKKSCKKYNWEILFCGPFPLPEELQNIENVRNVKEHGNVSRAVQVGLTHAQGKLIFIGNDDTVYREDEFDAALDLYNSECGPRDIMQCMYVEQGEKGGEPQPDEYWSVAFHGAFKNLKGIDQTWKLATEPVMHRSHFFDMGGFDCQWEYMDGSTHDFMWRSQRTGSKIVNSPSYVGDMNWWPDHQGDHGPIHDAMVHHDQALLFSVWGTENDRYKINYDNWKEQPSVWKRRFPGEVYDSYESLWDGEGYTMDWKPAP
tara:strand:- start:1470 stop:2321 length:852 start_codon:yes stop_codon:yes gene_type:complete